MNEKNKSKYIMDSKNKQNGITLISLVITIVIMLILAGVAISIAVDPEGLFDHAQNATEKWDAKITEEQGKVDEALGYLPGGSPSDLPAGWDQSKVADVVEEESTNRKAPIPVGYTASKVSTEDEIREGLVIYQTDAGQSAVEETADSDAHKAAMESRNQYVWIPVDDINDMVMCKKNNIDQGSYEENGETVTTKICKLEYDVANDKITCKTHGFDTTGYDTTANVLTKGNLDTVGLAGRLQNVTYTNSERTADNKDIYTYTQTENTSQTFSTNSEYREPAIVTGGNGTSYDGVGSNLTGITVPDDAEEGITVQDVFKAQLNKDFIAMAKSVAKYGGFYISRYEPSYANDKVISKKNKAVLTASTSTSGNHIAGEKWYGLYNKTLNSVEKGESVNSHMIWGCQYGQVIEFLGDTAEIGHLYQTTKQEKTGYDRVENGNQIVDQDILNNIYDLEGNNCEWTAQAGTFGRATGGCHYYYANIGVIQPASYRNGPEPTSTNDYYTTRPTLYIAL